MKVTINVSDELLQKIDSRAKSMYISRSAYISTALSQKLQQDEMLDKLPEFMVELKGLQKLAEKAEQKPDTGAGE